MIISQKYNKHFEQIKKGGILIIFKRTKSYNYSIYFFNYNCCKIHCNLSLSFVFNK